MTIWSLLVSLTATTLGLCRTGSRPTPAGQDAHVSVAADFIKKQLGGFFRGL
jgi:hypothetical protein